MAAIGTIAALALSAGATTVSTIQSADANGAAQKQATAQQNLEQEQINQAQTQLANQQNAASAANANTQTLAQQNALRASKQGQNGTLLTGPLPPQQNPNTPLGAPVGGATLLGG